MKIEEIFGSSGLDEMGEELQRLLPDKQLSFRQLTENIMEGDFHNIGEIGMEEIVSSIGKEWMGMKELLVSLVFIVFLSSFINIIKKSFQNKQIAEIAHYSNYLIMIILFIRLFGEIIGLCESTLRNIEQFMRIFFPAYFMLVGGTVGISSGLFYFQLAGLVIYFIEGILIHIMIPLLNIYMFLNFMNGIWEENRLSAVISLIKKGISLSFKIMLAMITGIGFTQSLILPLTDKIQKEGVYHLLDMIPGVGDAAKGVFSMWLGSALIVKNSVGIVGCFFLLLIVMTPLVKILAVYFILRVVSALLSIVCERKMIDCIREVGNGVQLCFQTTGYGVLFFIMLIAMSAYTGRGGY